MKPLKVSEVARLAHVTVRTLHHYDALGLVRPSLRGGNGYRLYTAGDLERLRAVLTWRALGVPLEAIGPLVDGADDARQTLTQQRQHLLAERERVDRLLDGVTAALAALTEGHPMDPTELFAPFAGETEQRWGHTEAFQASKRRTARYTKADWQRYRQAQQTLVAAMQAALLRGAAPTGTEAMELAERHREEIDRWFYTCPHPHHRLLGELYVTDARFTRAYDDVLPGLAQWLRQAIDANAARHGAS